MGEFRDNGSIEIMKYSNVSQVDVMIRDSNDGEVTIIGEDVKYLHKILSEWLTCTKLVDLGNKGESVFNGIIPLLFKITEKEIGDMIRQYRCDFPHDRKTDAQIRPLVVNEIRIKRGSIEYTGFF